MPTPSRHFKEELQELLDGRLDPAVRETVERHLESCAECRRELEALRWTKRFAAKQFAGAEEPAELRGNIMRAVRSSAGEDKSKIVRPNFFTPGVRSVLPWAALAAAVAILAASYFFWRPKLPELIARNYRAYEGQTLVLEKKTSDVKEMENYFAEHGVTFKTRVFDLDMMSYSLVGGRVQRVRGRPGALFVYRGQGEQPLLCQMFSGKVEDLPSGAVRREHKGIIFYRYQVKDLTVVFWPEGRVMCALVSDIAPKKVLDLAFAKAVKL